MIDMKKQTIMLTVLILISLKGISQTSNDDTTICIPKLDVQKAINIIETGKVASEELQITKLKLSTLESVVINKDSIISKLNIQIEDYKSIVKKQTLTEHNNNIIINNQNKLQDITDTKLKKQKINKWITLVLGATLGFLISK
jgi:hypothetical protein